MKISIVTVSYNSRDSIEATIKSILAQTYTDIEYIVIDGGSTDGTADLIKKYESEFSDFTFISEPDKGIYDALNKGIRLTNGDIVGIMHSDDVYSSPRALEQVVKSFEADSLDALYGDLRYVYKNNPEKTLRYWKSGTFSRQALKFGWMPPHPTLFLKKSIYTKHRLENGEYFDTDFVIAADYDFMLRVLKSADLNIFYLPELLVDMRHGGKSNRSLKNILRKMKEDLLVLRKNRIGGLHTLTIKNVRKISQFINKDTTV